MVETNLPEVEVDVIDHESEKGSPALTSIKAEPTICVRNNGVMDVFGKQGYSVVPISSKNKFIKNFIEYRSGSSHSKNIQDGENELFVVEKGDSK